MELACGIDKIKTSESITIALMNRRRFIFSLSIIGSTLIGSYLYHRSNLKEIRVSGFKNKCIAISSSAINGITLINPSDHDSITLMPFEQFLIDRYFIPRSEYDLYINSNC